MLTAKQILSDAEKRQSLYGHAMKWFPSECCGLLLDGPAGPEVVLADNLQDKYHRVDPEQYPRTSEDAYLLSPLLIANAERAGKRLVAIVHSHVRVGAYFSEEDTVQALNPIDGRPLYPGVEYVVIDAQDDGVRGFETFAFDDATGAFEKR